MSTIPIEVTVRDIPPTLAIESRIRAKAEKLALFYPRIEYCKVVVKVPQKHKHSGKLYNVRIELTVPGKKLVATHKKDEDLYVSIRDAFHAMTKQLEGYADKQHGEIKAHSPILRGRISRLFTDYGFIEALDGKEYYFSSSNLLYPNFDMLEIGSRVEFLATVGGDGLQATRVAVFTHLLEGEGVLPS